jgi:hypothetical protein
MPLSASPSMAWKARSNCSRSESWNTAGMPSNDLTPASFLQAAITSALERLPLPFLSIRWNASATRSSGRRFAAAWLLRAAARAASASLGSVRGSERLADSPRPGQRLMWCPSRMSKRSSSLKVLACSSASLVDRAMSARCLAASMCTPWVEMPTRLAAAAADCVARAEFRGLAMCERSDAYDDCCSSLKDIPTNRYFLGRRSARARAERRQHQSKTTLLFGLSEDVGIRSRVTVTRRSTIVVFFPVKWPRHRHRQQRASLARTRR